MKIASVSSAGATGAPRVAKNVYGSMKFPKTKDMPDFAGLSISANSSSATPFSKTAGFSKAGNLSFGQSFQFDPERIEYTMPVNVEDAKYKIVTQYMPREDAVRNLKNEIVKSNCKEVIALVQPPETYDTIMEMWKSVKYMPDANDPLRVLHDIYFYENSNTQDFMKRFDSEASGAHAIVLPYNKELAQDVRSVMRAKGFVDDIYMYTSAHAEMNDHSLKVAGADYKTVEGDFESAKDFIAYMKDEFSKAKEKFDLTGRKTVFIYDDMEKFLMPDVTTPDDIEAVKNLMSMANKDFHSQIQFTITQPDKILPEILESKEALSITDLSEKEISSELVQQAKAIIPRLQALFDKIDDIYRKTIPEQFVYEQKERALQAECAAKKDTLISLYGRGASDDEILKVIRSQIKAEEDFAPKIAKFRPDLVLNPSSSKVPAQPVQPAAAQPAAAQTAQPAQPGPAFNPKETVSPVEPKTAGASLDIKEGAAAAPTNLSSDAKNSEGLFKEFFSGIADFVKSHKGLTTGIVAFALIAGAYIYTIIEDNKQENSKQ